MTGAALRFAAAFCGYYVPDIHDTPDAMTDLMDAAERLYAEHGFAGVSIRQICGAAGQRAKSLVQYHFSGRDELIKAIIDRHVRPVDEYRMALLAELADKPAPTRRDRIACLVLPSVMHGIDLGTPSWHARFVAKALVEPSLRDYAIRSRLAQDSMRMLGQPPGELAAMIRQLVVHSCAELEYDLAGGRVPASDALRSWRRLGDRLVTAGCGMSAALYGPDERPIR